MSQSVQVEAHVLAAAGPDEPALPLVLVVGESAHVDRAVFAALHALAVRKPVRVRSQVLRAAGPRVEASAFSLVSLVVAAITANGENNSQVVAVKHASVNKIIIHS